jgi:hypothetical protein
MVKEPQVDGKSLAQSLCFAKLGFRESPVRHEESFEIAHDDRCVAMDLSRT